MKFEKLMLEYLTNKLKNKGYEVRAAIDKQFDILFKNPDEISFVVKTGNAVKSLILGYDLTQLPLNINITCLANESERLLNDLAELSEDDNTKLGNYSYRAIYSTPFITGNAFDIRTKTSTEKVVNIIWLINVTYGANSLLELPNLRLKIGEKIYFLEYVLRFSMASAPVYNSYQLQGDSRLSRDKVAENNTYSFQFYCVNSGVSELQDVLMKEIKAIEYIDDEALELLYDNDVINITQHEISLQYENAISVIVLNLVV